MNVCTRLGVPFVQASPSLARFFEFDQSSKKRVECGW